MWASAILRLARTIRLPIVGSATRNARAISPVVRPPSARSVSATRAGSSSAGMAAGEDQAQPVVDDHAPVVVHRRLLLVLGLEGHQLGQPLGAVGHRPVPAQAIDRAPPRGGRDPCPRIGRDAVAPPHRDRGLERVLHRVLGQLEVAGLPDQRGQHDRPFVAERARDRGRERGLSCSRSRQVIDRLVGHVDPGLARHPQPLPGVTTGRTSTVPQPAIGSRAACRSASSRSAHFST